MSTVSLTLDDFRHDNYGPANVTINLPLFLPTGKLPSPPILTDEPMMKSIIEKNLTIIRKLYDEHDDETIIERMRTGIIRTAFMDDSLVPESPEHTFVIRTMWATAAGYSTDEITEAGEDYGVDIGYKQYVQRLPLIEEFIQSRGSDEEIEKIKQLIPAHEILQHYTFLKATGREIEASIPNIWDLLAQSNCEGIKGVEAMALTLAGDSQGYSDDTLEELQSLSTTPMPIIEIIAGLRNVTVNPKVRESYVFQRILNRYIIVSRGLSNLVTLEEDVDNDRDRFNMILRRARSALLQGTALEAAIGTRVTDLTGQLKDLKMLITKLEKSYPLDGHLNEYLELIQLGWDAQLLTLVHSGEFDNVKAKVIIESN